MAHVKAPSIVKDELQNLLRGLAKELNRRVYGTEGVPWGTRFADIEEMAVQIGQVISLNMVEEGLASQPDDVPPEAKACSGCGGLVKPTGTAEPRAVITSVGTATWNDPQYYCPKCRAAFFPSVPRAGD
jgi:hypothetical protein